MAGHMLSGAQVGVHWCGGRGNVHRQVVVHPVEVVLDPDAVGAVIEIHDILAEGERVVVGDGRQPGHEIAVAQLPLVDVGNACGPADENSGLPENIL